MEYEHSWFLDSYEDHLPRTNTTSDSVLQVLKLNSFQISPARPKPIRTHATFLLLQDSTLQWLRFVDWVDITEENSRKQFVLQDSWCRKVLSNAQKKVSILCFQNGIDWRCEIHPVVDHRTHLSCSAHRRCCSWLSNCVSSVDVGADDLALFD